MDTDIYIFNIPEVIDAKREQAWVLSQYLTRDLVIYTVKKCFLNIQYYKAETKRNKLLNVKMLVGRIQKNQLTLVINSKKMFCLSISCYWRGICTLSIGDILDTKR